MEIHATRSKCQGHSMCHSIAPDIFPIDDDGYIEVDTIVVDEADAAKAKRGANMCPERALTVQP